MAPKIQHKRSSTASKPPTDTQLDPGEIALNTNATTANLHFKDAGNTVRSIGADPTAAGTYVRNIASTNAVGTWVAAGTPPSTIVGGNADRPTSPEDGQLFYNTDNETLWVWDDNNSTWAPAMVPVPTGGGEDYTTTVLNEQCFFNNEQTVNENYTVTGTTNSLSAGPITIDPAAIVTVDDGGTWTVCGGAGQSIDTAGFWSRAGTTLSPATSGDDIDDVGSITAAGRVDIQNGGDLVVRSSDGYVLAPTTISSANYAFSVAETGNGFQAGFKTDGSLRIGFEAPGSLETSPNITLNANDGSGYFAGNLQLYAGASDTAAKLTIGTASTGLDISLDNDRKEVLYHAKTTSADSKHIFKVNNSDELFINQGRIVATGNIIAEGAADNSGGGRIICGQSSSSGDDFRSGVSLAGQGLQDGGRVTIQSFLSYPETNRAFDIWHGQTTVYLIDYRGVVTVSNVVFELDRDNPEAYETREETYEEQVTGPLGNVERTVTKTREVKEYVGETLSVLDELQSLRARATQQDAVITQLVTAMRSQGVTIDTADLTQEDN